MLAFSYQYWFSIATFGSMNVKVAVIQESPIFFDKAKSLEKLAKLVVQASKEGAELIVFPESFIPGYPRGFDFGAKVGSRTLEGKQLYAKYYAESIDLAGEDKSFLERLAKQYQVYLVVGVTERIPQTGSLYCSMLYISPYDGLLGVHRKIKPTGTERLFWAEADGSSLVSFDTQIGKLGGLICWENYMPLARMSMYQQGVEIYIAPTADSRQDWTATMKHIALEGRCFVVGCNQYVQKEMHPQEYQKYITNEPDTFCEGGSIIVSPFGEVLAGPLFGASGILYATLELEMIIQSKLDFDVAGHYQRADIFEFKANKQPAMKREDTTRN